MRLAKPIAQSTWEALIGGAVFIVCGLVLALSTTGGGRTRQPGYDLNMRFSRADGIGIGSPVRLAGVVIGKVTAQRLDSHFAAVLTVRVAPDIHLPADSDAAIQSDSLLGGKFITVHPGGDDAALKPGDEIMLTQGSMDLKDILGQLIAQAQARQANPPTGGPSAIGK